MLNAVGLWGSGTGLEGTGFTPSWVQGLWSTLQGLRFIGVGFEVERGSFSKTFVSCFIHF